MFAALIISPWGSGEPLRSSFFSTKAEAIEYAERMPGVVAVEEIGGDPAIIWRRGEDQDISSGQPTPAES